MRVGRWIMLGAAAAGAWWALKSREKETGYEEARIPSREESLMRPPMGGPP